MQVTWVIEPEVFPSRYAAFIQAIQEAGHSTELWQDAWWSTGRWPRLHEHAVVFHGSLGNAALVRARLPWRPGAYCNTEAFHCSRWYPQAHRWLLHRSWNIVTAHHLVQEPDTALAPLGSPDRFFVRPDSPLKPFAGRVLTRGNLSLQALDHGFYYQDDLLPVVVAPVRSLEREWRYVVVDRAVVAGSRYLADGRSALPDDPGGPPWTFASGIAAQLEPPDEVYVLDICEAEGELFLLELNPFSGADLHACDPAAVATSVSRAAWSRLG